MLVKRNPFARTELHRERVPGECAECGQWAGRVRGADGTRGAGYVYRYRLEHDGGRVEQGNVLFCGEDCRKAYTNSDE